MPESLVEEERRQVEAGLAANKVGGQIVSSSDARRIRFLCRLSFERAPAGSDSELDQLRNQGLRDVAIAMGRIHRPDPALTKISLNLWKIATPLALGVGAVAWFLTASPGPLSMLLLAGTLVGAILFSALLLVFALLALYILFLRSGGKTRKDGRPDMRYRENRR